MYSEYFTFILNFRERSSFSNCIYPGEDELLALAQGALRVLNGEEQVMKY